MWGEYRIDNCFNRLITDEYLMDCEQCEPYYFRVISDDFRYSVSCDQDYCEQDQIRARDGKCYWERCTLQREEDNVTRAFLIDNAGCYNCDANQ
jgi:hypothetical protein